jgi:PAS domain S-box-containing protein
VTDAPTESQGGEPVNQSDSDVFFTLSLDLLCIAGMDGYFRKINPAFTETLGWSMDELVRRPFLEFVHPDDQAATLAEIAKLSAGITTIRFENRYLTREGGWRWLAWNTRPDAATGTLYAVARDVTRERELNQALRRAKEEAERASTMKSQFLANMSHELRTPLNAIIGYSEMLGEDAQADGNEQLETDLGRVRDAGRHLLDLINQMLDLSKVEAGRMETFFEAIEVSNLVDSLKSTIRPLVSTGTNRFRVEVADDVPVLTTDAAKLRQVLLNLLVNGMKFTHDGEVALSAERSPVIPGGVRFSVTDTGIGMNEDELSRVFEPFAQADVSTTRRYGGTGLGLSICSRFCDLLGAKLTVSSAPGEGTNFVVDVPSGAPTDAVAVPHGQVDDFTAQTADEVQHGDVVLVIDDDRDARAILVRMLEMNGHRVVSASGAEEGLALARRLRPHAVTLDLLMPGQDGWQILQALKEDPALRHTAVIIVSMLDETPLAFSLGADAFLSKPIDRETLGGTLDRCLATAPADARALVVEDDAMAREMVVRLLESRGWEVAEAADGLQAWEALTVSAPPDIVIVDLLMPGLTGFELLDRMQATTELSAVPVVVLTGRDLTTAERDLLDGRVRKILEKSAVSGDEIATTIRRATRRTGRHAAVEDS